MMILDIQQLNDQIEARTKQPQFYTWHPQARVEQNVLNLDSNSIEYYS